MHNGSIFVAGEDNPVISIFKLRITILRVSNVNYAFPTRRQSRW